MSEAVTVTENGVDEADTASNAGCTSMGEHDEVVNEAEATCLETDVDAASKATTELGVSKIFDSTCKVLSSLTPVGVDPAKILIGKTDAVVMFEVVAATR